MSKQVLYTVTGKWPFPSDMLRYDHARAATPQDQAQIDLASLDHPSTTVALRHQYTINLVIDGVNTRFSPNVARWNSFGWTVTEVDGEPYVAYVAHPYVKPVDHRQAVIDAAMALVEAQEAFYAFERDNPNNSTSRWDAVFDAKNSAYDTLKKAVEKVEKLEPA